MAEKQLKSIKFQGLNTTYVIPEVDPTSTVSGDAADAKVVGDHINNQSNPHNVTLEQISGTLPVVKGGTGGTTALEARRKLGTANSYNIFPDGASQYNNVSYGWVQTNHFASPTAANGGYGDGYYTILDSNGIFHVGTQLNQASSITWSKLYGEKNIIYSSTQPTGTKGMIWLKPV